MNRLRLIILLMFGSFLVMAQQIDAVVGMGYYDYLTRPEYFILSGNTYKLSKSGQGYSYLGALIGLKYKYHINSSAQINLGMILVNRRRLIYDVFNSGNILMYQSRNMHSILLDLPVGFDKIVGDKWLVGFGLVPAFPLYKWHENGQRFSRSGASTRMKPYRFDFSANLDLGYRLNKEDNLKLRFMYSPQRSFLPTLGSNAGIFGILVVNEIKIRKRKD